MSDIEQAERLYGIMQRILPTSHSSKQKAKTIAFFTHAIKECAVDYSHISDTELEAILRAVVRDAVAGSIAMRN